MFTLLYDGEFVNEFENASDALDEIHDDYLEFLNEKQESPDSFEEDEVFPFELYQIDMTFMTGHSIEEFIKNKS